MTSSRERQQRAAARARLARQMAERQEAARRRRQRRLTVGVAVAVVLVLAGTTWAVVSLTGDESTPATAAGAETPGASADPAAAPGPCVWNEVPPGDTVVDVGVPPEGEPREGFQDLTVSTNRGDIKVRMDLSEAPCIAASFSHLASQDFYQGSKCHRMFSGMLQCGDPTARGEGYRQTDGTGGPSYQFPNENLPTNRDPAWYPAGTMALANSGPDTNGSQFFFIYRATDLDGPNYSVVGEIYEGLDVLSEIESIGHDGAFDPSPGGGHPNEDIIVESVTVSEPVTSTAPATGPSPGATPSQPAD